MAANQKNKPKTVLLPPDVIRAIDIHIAQRKGNRNSASNFSEAVTQGLRLFLSHNRTSVPKLLGATQPDNQN